MLLLFFLLPVGYLLTLVGNIPFVNSLGSCHTCVWIRYGFPKHNHCAYYQKPCIDAIKNCSHYDISFKLIKRGL
jgi:hypothetical protein